MADDPQQTTDELGTSDQTDDAQTENENADARLDTVERRVEDHQAILDGLKEHLGGDGDGLGPVSTRRGVLTAGGVLGLLGLGAGTASADASGQVGTSSDPLSELYTEELNGGITGDTSLTNIAGQGLTIDNSGNLKISGGSKTSKLKTSGSTVTAMNVLDGSSSVSASSDGATPPNILGGHPSNNTGASTVKGVTISGGGGDSASSKDNTASADFATIGGGNYHLASGSNATIAGGNFNKATASNATVGGGTTNDASGSYATIPGGNNNLADGDNSFAAGRFGETNGNDGAFVWGDSSSTRAKAQATDEVRFQATGGFVIENGNLDAQGGTIENTTGGLTVQSSGSNDITLSPGGDVTLSGTLDATDHNIKTTSGDLKLNPHDDVVITPTGNDYEPLRVTDKDGNEFLVADIGNNRLQVFDDGGSNHLRIRHTGTNARIEAPNSEDNLELTASGNIVVKDVLRPDDDASTDLGASSNKWHEIYAANGTIQTSDARLKDTVSDLADGYEKVRSMRPVSYKWAEERDSDTHLGFLAQEIEEIVPEAVDRPEDDENGHLGLRYQELIPVIVSALQEQQSISSDLEADLNAKGARIADQRDRIKRLESNVDNKDVALNALREALNGKDERIDDLETKNEQLRERNAELEDRLATVEAELGIDATASQQGVADD